VTLSDEILQHQHQARQRHEDQNDRRIEARTDGHDRQLRQAEAEGQEEEARRQANEPRDAVAPEPHIAVTS
jgi:hypothetical protein